MRQTARVEHAKDPCPFGRPGHVRASGLGPLSQECEEAGGRVEPDRLQPSYFSRAEILFIFGFVVPNVDNYAHAGGFAGGYLASRFLDPLKPERLDHMVIALGCLVLTMLSIVVSVLHGLTL